MSIDQIDIFVGSDVDRNRFRGSNFHDLFGLQFTDHVLWSENVSGGQNGNFEFDLMYVLPWMPLHNAPRRIGRGGDRSPKPNRDHLAVMTLIEPCTLERDNLLV